MTANIDLFGFPIVLKSTSSTRRSREIPLAMKRIRFFRHMEASPNLLLFDELLDVLSRPLMELEIPTEYQSDIAEVAVLEDEIDDDEEAIGIEIPYNAWGKPWVSDRMGFHWSEEGIQFFQNHLFWRSMHEMTLHNNAREKLSVLKWVFRPAVVRDYIFDKVLERSHCLTTHEREDTFSFHNCCMAARIDEDEIREGFRRNISPRILRTVEKGYAF